MSGPSKETRNLTLPGNSQTLSHANPKRNNNTGRQPTKRAAAFTLVREVVTELVERALHVIFVILRHLHESVPALPDDDSLRQAYASAVAGSLRQNLHGAKRCQAFEALQDGRVVGRQAFREIGSPRP